MNREQHASGERAPFCIRATARGRPKQRQRELKEQNDIECVQRDVGHVKSKRPRSPDRAIEGVRGVDDGTLDVVQHHRPRVQRWNNRGIGLDRVVVVVDERIVQGVDVDERAQKRRDQSQDRRTL